MYNLINCFSFNLTFAPADLCQLGLHKFWHGHQCSVGFSIMTLLVIRLLYQQHMIKTVDSLTLFLAQNYCDCLQQ